MMTIEEVRELVRAQSADSLMATNDHRITLKQALAEPQRISVIARLVKAGRVQDERLNVWLVGQEDLADGYKIVMRDDGSKFGLASSGSSSDKYLVLRPLGP
jgi:hypothetical protein